MIVLIVTACPAGLRGDLTKWLTELSPGVFVGTPSARIRELLWARTSELCKDGRALLVQAAKNEQGMEVRTHRHDGEPADFDGLTLLMRPQKRKTGTRRTGWSNARQQRRSYNQR